METNEKLEQFQDELGHFSEENLRAFTEHLLTDTADWFYVDPASTSGKHHPEFSLGNGGLVRHTRAVVYWLWELYRSEIFKLSAHQIELLNIAAIAHDIRKHDDDGKYISTHPRAAYEFIMAEREKYSDLISEEDAQYIANAIVTHMGIWGKRDGEKAPETKSEVILHLADLIASRKEMSLDFLVDLAKHAPIAEAKQPKEQMPILDDPGQCKINFGKYNGLTVEELYNKDPGYLDWIEREPDFGQDYIKNNVLAFLKKKRNN